MNHGVLTDIKSASVSSQAVGNTRVLFISHTVRAFCPHSSYKLRGQRRDGQRGRSNWGSPEEIMEEAAICNSETLPDAGSRLVSVRGPQPSTSCVCNTQS